MLNQEQFTIAIIEKPPSPRTKYIYRVRYAHTICYFVYLILYSVFSERIPYQRCSLFEQFIRLRSDPTN